MSQVIEYYGFDPDDETQVMEHANQQLAEKMFKCGDDKRAKLAVEFMVFCARKGHELTLDQLQFIYHSNWRRR